MEVKKRNAADHIKPRRSMRCESIPRKSRKGRCNKGQVGSGESIKAGIKKDLNRATGSATPS